MSRPADQGARDRAIQPTGSFIVQAPAGSGKTELLTQRFLRLLSGVDRPERILAITFTRKATREMRDRILKRLQQAERNEVPEAPHEAEAVRWAAAALERDRAEGWGLTRNPARLRIQTIDSFCSTLAGRDALRGRGAGMLRVEEDARPLYRDAAQAMIEELGSGEVDERLQAALQRVLVHLDGDAGGLQQLLVWMLDRRDQWLDRIGADVTEQRDILKRRQRHEWDALQAALGADALSSAIELTVSLANDADPDAEFLQAVLAEQGRGTGDSLADRIRRAVAVFTALTDKGQTALRATLGKQFPGLDDRRADNLAELEAIVRGWRNDDRAARAAVEFLKGPPLPWSKDEASLLQDLQQLLRASVAWLNVEMERQGRTDFVSLAERALAVLGEPGSPNPALLAEDHRLEHILMDEFQDTSHTQHQLLERLVGGWTPDDGRTLFLVGDPMQSIYRFRKADVQLFTETFERGHVAGVPIEPLVLTVNFRSRPTIVSWVNEHVGAAFPPQHDDALGSVGYTPVDASREPGGNVRLAVVPPGGNEAGVIVDWLRELANAGHENGRIGILARTRQRLTPVAAALDAAGIAYEAVDVVPLRERAVVQELLAITRILWHPGDRVAALAMLRAPWCGLTAEALWTLMSGASDQTLLERCTDGERRSRLGDDDAGRVQHLGRCLERAMAARATVSLPDRVEALWVMLGGPLAASRPAELEDAEVYLARLREVMAEHPGDPIAHIDLALERLYARSGAARVQLMTVHKAKGLEFDFVAVTGLGDVPGGGSADRPLVRLQEFRDATGSAVLAAPIGRARQDERTLYHYLQRLDTQQNRFESDRVLYVATTRAREAMLLTAEVARRPNGAVYPKKHSWLERLWPAFEADGFDGLDDAAAAAGGSEPVPLPLWRLSAIPDIPIAPTPSLDASVVGWPDLPSRPAVAFGSALHFWLELAHDHPSLDWSVASPAWAGEALRSSLSRFGGVAVDIGEQASRLERSLRHVLEDPSMATVVFGGGGLSYSEFPLFEQLGERLSMHVIDRLWRDDSGWMIADYKTGSSGHSDAWSAQLQRYADLVTTIGVEGAVRGEIVHFDGDDCRRIPLIGD